MFRPKVDDTVLNKTVMQLGLQDKVPFLPIEEKAGHQSDGFRNYGEPQRWG